MLIYLLTHLGAVLPSIGTAPRGWYVYWDRVPHVAAGFGTARGHFYKFLEFAR